MKVTAPARQSPSFRIVFVISAVIASWLLGKAACHSLFHPGAVLDRVASPDGSLDVVVARTPDGGALSDAHGAIFVVAHGASPLNDDEVCDLNYIFSRRGAKGDRFLFWDGPHDLRISIDSADIYSFRNFAYVAGLHGTILCRIRLDAAFYSDELIHGRYGGPP